MGQVLLRALALLKRPAVALAVLVLAAGGAALTALPLFNVPGFELGAALALGVGLVGGGVGVASAWQERRLLQGRDPRPAGALRQDSAFLSTWLAFAAALLVLTAALLVPFLVATGVALAGTACDPLALAAFYPVLALPSAVLAAAAGVLCGLWGARLRSALGGYALLVGASLVVTAWPLVAGPQIFAFNHFLGHLPGPLYDEALALRPPLLWFRLQTLLWAAALWLLASLCLDTREGRLRRPHLRPGSFALLALALAGAGLIEVRAPSLGLRMTDAFLEERLGGVRETPHFRLVYPRGKPHQDVERLLRDLEFRHSQLAEWMGAAPEGRIRVWLYRSPAEKAGLVGAGRTQFAKPWRYEVHVDDQAFPHPVLRHELAHVMAASAGAGPFRVTARAFGLWPLMGVIEGMAVGADAPVQGDLTLHEWAAGMRRKGLAPDVRHLVGPEGFYASAPARAYTLVGSFLRHLHERYGAERLRTLYARADFEAAYGQPLDALATEWEQRLDALPLEETALERAFARFRTGALHTRACAREVAKLADTAREVLPSDPDRALELYQRAAELQPGEPGYRQGQATALALLDRKPEAAGVLALLSGDVAGQGALEAEVALAQADLALDMAKPDVARKHLERIVGLAPSPEVLRTALVKLAALEDPVRGRAVGVYFRPGADELRLLALQRALEESPRDAVLHYLLGRRLHALGAPRLALTHLQRAVETGPLLAPVQREALRLQVQSAYLAGDCGAVRHYGGALPDLGLAFRLTAGEWVARCAFEERSFGGALVPEEPFR